MVVEAQGLIILVRGSPFFQLPKFGAKPLRFCTRNTESCQVLTGPLGGGWSGGVLCLRWAIQRENQMGWRRVNLFWDGLFSGDFVKFYMVPKHEGLDDSDDVSF